MAPKHKEDPSCFIYGRWKNASSNGLLISSYEGIPQNLVVNICGCLCLLIIFAVLRKKAWNYGRSAFVQKSQAQLNHTIDDPDILYGGMTVSTVTENSNRSIRRRRSRNLIETPKPPVEILINDHGYFRWLWTVFRLTDDQIRAKSGSDAIHYLSFQRHLIFLGCIFLIVSVTIILPINCQGGEYESADSFARCTIQNLGESGQALWVHDSLPLIYLILSIVVLRHFSKSLAVVECDPIITRTIMISRIAKRNSNATKLAKHFQEIYPDCEIEEISFAYNITALQDAEHRRKAAVTARMYWENYFQTTGKRPTMQPYHCGKLLRFFNKCGLKSVDAIEFYLKEEERYQNFVTLERKKALTQPLGIAFVTFNTSQMAHRAVLDHRSVFLCCKQRPTSTFSRKLRSHYWTVTYAPIPEDLYWGNLSLSCKAWYLKFFLLNIMLIIIVIVYSTPVFILNALNQGLNITTKFENKEKSTFGHLFPSILLWITAFTLPSLVSVSDGILGFWTKTAENRSRMIKTFTFLLAMVIILPSLGQQSVFVIIQKSSISLRCIYNSTNGIFFVNYVITSAFLGAASELMRPGELFCYIVRLCFAKSSAEIDNVRKSVLFDFQFGSQYAWVMLNFAMFVIFSFIFPVITPFGLVYLLMKHYVDRYNIYFAYSASTVDNEVHVTAINFVFCTLFLLQIMMLTYTNIEQTESIKYIKVFTVICSCLTAAFFITQLFFNMCTSLSPFAYEKSTGKPHRHTMEPRLVSITSESGLDVESPVESAVDNSKVGGGGVDGDNRGGGGGGGQTEGEQLPASETTTRQLFDPAHFERTTGKYYPKILQIEPN